MKRSIFKKIGVAGLSLIIGLQPLTPNLAYAMSDGMSSIEEVIVDSELSQEDEVLLPEGNDSTGLPLEDEKDSSLEQEGEVEDEVLEEDEAVELPEVELPNDEVIEPVQPELDSTEEDLIPEVPETSEDEELVEDLDLEDLIKDEEEEDALNVLSNEQLVSKLNTLALVDGVFKFEGYSYLAGVSMQSSSDVKHQLLVLNAETGVATKTYSLSNIRSTSISQDRNHGAGVYNYDWAKFGSTINLSAITPGTYYFQLKTTVGKVSKQEFLPVHSNVVATQIEVGGKTITFERVKKEGVTTIRMTIKLTHVKRLSVLEGRTDGLYLSGYSYITYASSSSKGNVSQKLKFVDPKTGKQVVTFSLPTYYSTDLSKDPNHGNGEYNYDWSKFKGTIDVDNVPAGEYYLKIFTRVGDRQYDEAIQRHSSLKEFTYESSTKIFKFEAATVYKTDSLKVTVVDKPSVPSTKSVVVLDAGHGGTDSGAVGAGFKEKDLNLDITLAAAKYLREQGVTVRLTRETDKTMSLSERSSYINSINPDLAVSIHNDADIAGAKGAHVIYSLWDRNGGTGKTLAQNLLDSVVANTVQTANGRGIWYRLHPDNSQLDYYHMIRETRKPTVIIECSFMNTSNISAVNTSAKREQMGIAIAKGILKTLGY